MPLRAFIVIVALLLTAPLCAQTRRALLIGINDYTMANPRWPNLSGAVNDVTTLREMLLLVHGFKGGDVVVLIDKQATRAAIVKQLDALVRKSAKGDLVVFYFAGHGSQLFNSRSQEIDRLDETIVPADSRVASFDIRDKELRRSFNAMLDRGARLTVIFDACYSGSGARTGARSRGVRPDLRDVADGTDYGPRPESRGALVLSATQDSELAFETEDHDKKQRGAFSWALITALRDAEPGEAAEETFLRARARLYADRPFQQPVLAGNAAARRAPLFGVRTDRRNSRALVGVAKVSGGTATLQGGWANGLAPGTRLRAANGAALIVTAVSGMVRSEARVESGRVQAGTLAEVTRWTAPPGRKLRVWSPNPVDEDVEHVEKADADYVLEQRGRLFSWVRPSATAADTRRSGLPLRTAWTATPEESLRVLRKIHGWLTLQSPAGPRYPYRLLLRSGSREARLKVRTGETYTLHLKANRPKPQRTRRRYVYVFTIDSSGRSVLLFPSPDTGSVENRFPFAPDVIPDEIPLGTTVRIEPPLGVDVWFLLTTEEPIANPAILEWDGVRAGRANWSIERLMVESVPAE